MRRTKKFPSRVFVAVIAAALFGCAAILDLPDASSRAQPLAAGGTLYGFIPFPFDLTFEAIDETYRIADREGTLYVQHRDNGIPWQEALEGAPFPQQVRDDWADYARRRPSGKKAYLALAPLAEDRVSLIHASEGSRTPAQFLSKRLDDEGVKRAYLNYVLRAIDHFQPDYLNLGVEAGELAARDPSEWPRFVALYTHVRDEVKRRHPQILVGISFGLQSLMRPDVAERARAVVDSSDYLCLSFYPYMSAFHERFGAPALLPPPREWQAPLEWVRNFTDKPIALCETGYNSAPAVLAEHDLRLHGSAELQTDYVTDLGRLAAEHHYLFVIWFLPVDYQRLFEKLDRGDDVHKLWEHNGLLDSALGPKPAWAAWRRVVASSRAQSGPSLPPPGTTRAPPAAPQFTLVPFDLGFATPADLFAGSEHDAVALDEGPRPGSGAMRWSFDYSPGRFQWIAKRLERANLSGAQSSRFWIRSNVEGPVILQLTEASGEAFFTIVQPAREWLEVRLELRDFQVDPEKRQDGQLQADNVVEILLADAGAVTESAAGSRTIWIADWTIE